MIKYFSNCIVISCGNNAEMDAMVNLVCPHTCILNNNIKLPGWETEPSTNDLS